MHFRSERRPAIVATTAPPRNPSRSPFVIWDPSPSIPIRVHPSPVVERRPSPLVMRDPSVAIFCHYPVSVGRIGHEIGASIRQPDITVVRIVHPFSVRGQLIVKQLE